MSEEGDPSNATYGRCATGSYVGSKCGQVGVWVRFIDRPIAATVYTLSNGDTIELIDVDWTTAAADPIHFGPVRNASGSVTKYCTTKLIGSCNIELTPSAGPVEAYFAYIYAYATQTVDGSFNSVCTTGLIVSTINYDAAWFRRVMSAPTGKESFFSHLDRDAWLALENTLEADHGTYDTSSLKHIEGNDALTADLNPAYKNDDGSSVLINAPNLTEVAGFDCASEGAKCMPDAYAGVRHNVIVSGLSSVCSTIANIGAPVTDSFDFEFDLADPCEILYSTGEQLHVENVTGLTLADCGNGYNASPNPPTASVSVEVWYNPYYTFGTDRPIEVVVTISFINQTGTIVETVTEYIGFNLLISSGVEIATKTSGVLSVEFQLA